MKDLRSTAGPRDGAGRSATPDALTRRRSSPFLIALVPLALALVAVPGRTVPASVCPPGGEGYVGCQIYKGWAPYITSVSLVWLGLYVAGQLAFLVLPQAIRRYRAGERLRQVPRMPTVLNHADPALAAAAWGQSATATPATRVMGGFAWAQAANRSGRVTASPELLLGAAARKAAPVLSIAPAAPSAPAAPAAPARPVRTPSPVHRVQRPAASHLASAVEPRLFRRSPHGATRVVLLTAGLDPQGIARLEEALVGRPGEARRVVVLQVPAGERLRPGALPSLMLAARTAHDAGGEIVIVSADDDLRDRLAGLELPVAASTPQAMEIANAFAPVLPAQPVQPASDRLAL